MSHPRTFIERRFAVAAEREDDVAAELVARGALGCEIVPGDAGSTVVAFFPDPLPCELEAWDPAAWGATFLGEERLVERDWLAEYRAGARPLAIGRRFLVDPRDEGASPSPPENADRVFLRIPARTAFGTGSHGSTRLVLEWLEELADGEGLRGVDVLDVGTGSGLLAFAALRLGARRAVAFDLDAGAVLIARANARLNGFPPGRPRLWAGRLAALRRSATFGLALVNVLPERIVDELPELAGHLPRDARLVSSGNLRSDRRRVLDRWVDVGFELAGEKHDDEWIAFLLSRR